MQTPKRKGRHFLGMSWRGALLVSVLALTIRLGITSSHDWNRYRDSTHRVEHTYKILVAAESLRNSVEDAESGQRGYLLTGDERYLAPYNSALSHIIASQVILRQLMSDNPQQQAKLLAFSRSMAEKLAELRQTIELRRTQGFAAALEMVRTDRGQKAMDEIRGIADDLQEDGRRMLERSSEAEAQAVRSRSLGGLSGLAILILLILATIAIERDTRNRIRMEEALRDSEAQFRQVFEESPSGILLIEEDQRVRRANPAFCRILGRTEEELRQLSSITAQDGLLHLMFETGWIAPGEQARFHAEQEYVTKSGDTAWVNVHATKLYNSEGRAVCNLALVEDITERKKADQEVRVLNDSLEQRVAQRTAEAEESNHKLESANRELEAFAYSVSHDLRAPLRSVDSFSQIILDEYSEKLDEEGVKYLRRIRAGAQNMGQLINDLLNLSRVSRGLLKLGPVNLSSIASTVVNELRDQEPQRTVDIEIVPDIQANCDPQLLRVVLTNLIGNAWKFTGKCEKAGIEFGASSEEGLTVYFVRDNGAGFDMAFASQLFAPFQRLHQTTEFAGTGIGLATVQRIIQRHGGRIWAESSVENGATFYFTLAGNGASGSAKEKTKNADQTDSTSGRQSG
jgi:PAS domain S-box-containing protein